MRLNVLDSLRGVFALMIVLLHTDMQSHLFYMDFVRNSDIFVDFFFVLSGFVISLSYMGKTGKRYALPEFMLRRTGRLWPLHMVVLVGFVLLVLIKALVAALGIFAADVPYTKVEITRFTIENIFLVQAFRNETVLWLNFPAWSISAEFWAYALFGVLCLAPLRWIPWLASLSGLIAFAALQGWVDFGFGAFVNYGLFRGICYFMLGHLCYLLWLKLRHLRLRAATGVEIGVVVLIVLQTIHAENEIVRMLMPLTFVLAILIFTFEGGVVSRLLSLKTFRILGDRSYSIYMIHALILNVVGLMVRMLERILGQDLYSANQMQEGTPMLIDFGAPWMMDIATLLLAIVVIWLSGFTYRYVEMPGQAWTNSRIVAWRLRREVG